MLEIEQATGKIAGAGAAGGAARRARPDRRCGRRRPRLRRPVVEPSGLETRMQQLARPRQRIREGRRGRRGGSTSWATSAGRSRVCVRPWHRRTSASTAAIPRAKTAPSVPTTSTVSPSSKPPTTPDDAGRERGSAVDGEGPGAPSSTTTTPSTSAGERDPQLARRQPCGRGRRTWCRRQYAGDGLDQHVRRRPALAITAADARPRGDPGGGELRRHAAAPPAAAAGVGARSTAADRRPRRRRSELALGSTPRVGACTAPSMSVSSTSRSALHVVGDERGDAGRCRRSASRRLAMASFSLTIGTQPELEQAHQRLAGVQVLAAVDEVVRHRAAPARRPGRDGPSDRL